MRKGFIFVAILLLIGLWGWSKYGTYFNLFRNTPPSGVIDVAPTAITPSVSDPKLNYLELPSGFNIQYFADNVPGARSLTRGASGTVYVGTRPQGVVYALEDENLDGVADKRYVVANDLNSPNGVAYMGGDLYVAEISRIIKFEGIDTTYQNKPEYKIVYDKLPSDAHHGWKYLSIGPDNKLYVAIGMPCNVCEAGEIYGTILRLNLDGSNPTIVARGIRNSVGFDWDPVDDSLWFTDNGRDNLGEDIPPDELNRVGAENLNFGFPYCHAGIILDPVFGKGKNCGDFVAPASVLGPHVAALGMKFYTGNMFPPQYRNKILIAEHGSWNRKVPIGYRVSTVDVTRDKSSNYSQFITGWLATNGKITGRPVDILELDDGSILISDDFAGAVYRVTYRPK